MLQGWNFRSPIPAPGLLWIPGMFVFSRWSHEMTYASFCILYNPWHTLTSTSSILVCTNKGKQFKAGFPGLVACGYWLWYFNCSGPRKLSFGFPKSAALTQEVSRVLVHTPGPNKAVMGASPFPQEHCPPVPTYSPSVHRVQIQVLTASRKTKAEASVTLSSPPTLHPSGKISPSFIKQNSAASLFKEIHLPFSYQVNKLSQTLLNTNLDPSQDLWESLTNIRLYP